MRRHLFAALAACAVVLQSAPPAQAASAVGVSLGMAQRHTTKPLDFGSYHSTSNFRYRWDVLTPYTEMMFGFVNRSQTLHSKRTEVFDTTGLSLSAGAHWGFLHLGSAVEAAWLRTIYQNNGQLAFGGGGGFIVEPYLGVTLPVLKSEVTELELSVHYPVLVGNLDATSIGPRLLLTMWLGGEGGDDEEEEEDEEAAEEEMEEDEEVPAPQPEVAPKPAPKPSTKPVPPAKPPVKKPAKKK